MASTINRRGFVASTAGATVLINPIAAFAIGTGFFVATATGPIPNTAQLGKPFHGASDQPLPGPGLPSPDLSVFDYVEEEYFISGIANAQPYKTSLLVRKPRDARKFSGLVAVETIHSLGSYRFWQQQMVCVRARFSASIR